MGKMSELEGMLEARRLFAVSAAVTVLGECGACGQLDHLAGRGEPSLDRRSAINTPSLFLPSHQSVLSLAWWKLVSYPNVRLAAPEYT